MNSLINTVSSGKAWKQKKKKKMPEQVQRPKDFLDMIAPAAVKFNTDHFILGSRYHTAMALKSYPPVTDELALLRGLGDMGGVNLRLTARQVTPAEEDAILHAATNKSRMERSNTNDYKQSVTAEANLRDMAELLAKQRQEKEPLIHCGVYLDIAATDTEKLRAARLMRSNLAGCRTPAMVVYFLRQKLYNENRKHCAAIV